eukprot:1161555-Pelagomonas_calceolata.AAC.2
MSNQQLAVLQSSHALECLEAATMNVYNGLDIFEISFAPTLQAGCWSLPVTHPVTIKFSCACTTGY